MIKAMLAFVRPLHTIAKELTILRQLYQSYLEEKHGIVLETAAPHKDDTAVSYSGESDDRAPYKRWFQANDELMDEDEQI